MMRLSGGETTEWRVGLGRRCDKRDDRGDLRDERELRSFGGLGERRYRPEPASAVCSAVGPAAETASYVLNGAPYLIAASVPFQLSRLPGSDEIT